VRGEYLTTLSQSLAGDDEQENPTGLQPAIRVTQERLLCAATVSRPECPIVRWIQIEETKALDRALDFQRISLDYVRNPLPGLLGPVSIKLNAVAKHLCTVSDNLERRAIANTRVDRGRRSAWELEKPANSLGFGQWQWVETKPTFADKAHWGPPFSEEPVRSSWRKSLGLFLLKWGSGSQMGDEWMYNRSRWKAKMEIPV